MSVENCLDNSISALNEGFEEGGDLALRSIDGVTFSVHSLLLTVASPLLSALITTEDKGVPIQFPENAKVLALLLKFIYPNHSPVISSMDLFNDVLRVATQFQLDSMKARLREKLTHVNSPVSVLADPLGVLYVASTHGFTAEAELAANLVPNTHKFTNEEDLKTFLDAAPIPATDTLVKLTGIPLVKTRVLVDVLFHFERSSMTIYNEGSGLTDALVCRNCKWIFKGVSRQSPPEWQFRWAHWIFEETKDRPIVEWKGYFQHSSFNRAFYQPHLSATYCAYRYCSIIPQCECVRAVTNSTNEFQNWAGTVFEHLISRLSNIAELEARSGDPNFRATDG